MRYDAKALRYEMVEIFGKNALFTDDRIIKDSVPEEFSLYEVRYDENVRCQMEIVKGTPVHFYGTLLIQNGLQEVEENGRVLVTDGEWKRIGEKTCTLDEYSLQQNGKLTEQYLPLVQVQKVTELLYLQLKKGNATGI